MRTGDLPRWQIVALVCLVAILFFAYLPLTQSVFFGGDLVRLYLPQQTIVATALRQRELAWWAPDIGAGYPLLAEGESGALYPLNLLLHLWLPPEVVLTVSVLLHLALAGWGGAALARSLGLSRGGALLTGLTYALGGFTIAHASHVAIISVTAWFPWMLAAIQHMSLEDGVRARCGWTVALVTAVALQFLAGHAQMSLLLLLPAAAWTMYLCLRKRYKGGALRLGLMVLAGVGLGVVLAGPQLLASVELAGLSQRASGVDSAFFTSFSFHPLLTATFLTPFILGNPYPTGSVELMGYCGLLTVLLAWLAILYSHRRGRWAWVTLGLVGLLLALGRWNPLYGLLARVPVVNLFRVPARYLLWTSLALAVLAGEGLDTLLERGSDLRRLPAWVLAPALLSLSTIVAATLATDADTLIAWWRWFPLVHLASALLWLRGTRHLPGHLAVALAILIVTADLYAYGSVLRLTFNGARPLAEIRQTPALLSVLEETGPFRTWTTETIVPTGTVQRASLYPNIGAGYGVAGASLYMPLVPRTYGAYVADPDATTLDRLNVRYVLIPQVLPTDETAELYDVSDPFASLPYNLTHEVAVTDVVTLQVESFLSHAAALEQGTLVASLHLERARGAPLVLQLRAGMETAEWALEREDVTREARHGMAPVASTFPAVSSYRAEAHPGHVYQASWTLESPADITSFRIENVIPEAFVRIESIRFIDSMGRQVLAGHLLGRGDHEIVYRSEDVVAYRNNDSWPRAWCLSAGRFSVSGQQVALDDDLTASDLQPVSIVQYEPTRVTLQATCSRGDLLVLADMHYPGWEAQIGDHSTGILTVDGLFRGVVVPAGDTDVVFRYNPSWLWWRPR
ncbi:MAG: hypothetical protein ACOX2L_04855 [Anaerolineae bacterium]